MFPSQEHLLWVTQCENDALRVPELLVCTEDQLQPTWGGDLPQSEPGFRWTDRPRAGRNTLTLSEPASEPEPGWWISFCSMWWVVSISWPVRPCSSAGLDLEPDVPQPMSFSRSSWGTTKVPRWDLQPGGLLKISPGSVPSWGEFSRFIVTSSHLLHVWVQPPAAECEISHPLFIRSAARYHITNVWNILTKTTWVWSHRWTCSPLSHGPGGGTWLEPGRSSEWSYFNLLTQLFQFIIIDQQQGETGTKVWWGSLEDAWLED